MATLTGAFRPAQALMTGSATALQLRMYLGRLIGIYLRGMQIGNRFLSQTINEGLSWQCPAYGLVEDGKYHVATESVLTDSGYLQQVPFADKTFFIDLPWVNNIITPSFDMLQTHYANSVESLRVQQLVERQARHTDLKACRMLANAGEAAANVTGGSVPAASATPAGYSVTNSAALTSATVILDFLRLAATRFDENDLPDDQRYFACHPAQYHLLVADRQLLDGDVQRVRGSNGDYPSAVVYQAHGFMLIKSTALKAMRTAGDYTNVTGDNNTYTATSTGTHAANAGVCFTNQSCIRMVRKELEVNSWYENDRFSDVVTTRVIDGYGTYRPETVATLRTS